MHSTKNKEISCDIFKSNVIVKDNNISVDQVKEMRKEACVINIHVHTYSHANTNMYMARVRRMVEEVRNNGNYLQKMKRLQTTVKVTQSFLHCCIGQPREQNLHTLVNLEY